MTNFKNINLKKGYFYFVKEGTFLLCVDTLNFPLDSYLSK
jgi:uncharacterized lipoprotein NlpE involved in copper resistance